VSSYLYAKCEIRLVGRSRSQLQSGCLNMPSSVLQSVFAFRHKIHCFSDDGLSWCTAIHRDCELISEGALCNFLLSKYIPLWLSDPSE
jgi:hypothetical protein